MLFDSGRYVPLVLVLALAACAEVPTVAPELPEAPQATVVASTGCTNNSQFINGIGNSISRFFRQPLQGQANTHFNALKSACSASNGAEVSSRALAILALVEEAYNAENAINQVSHGVGLVRNLLICATTPCAGSLSPALDETLLGQVFTSPRGLIALRTGGNRPALARAKVGFSNSTNNALWGTVPVEPATWPNLIEGPGFIFIYGNQSGPAPASGRHTSLRVKRWPSDVDFADQMVVGACFDSDVTSPPGQTMFVSRRPTPTAPKQLSVFVSPTWDCLQATGMLEASIIAPVVAMTRSFRLTRAVAFSPSVRVGTGTKDWSVFSSEELNQTVALSIPKNLGTQVAGVSFNVPVTARANPGSIPVSAAKVTLRIFNNSGSSGGAELSLIGPNGETLQGPAAEVSMDTGSDGIANFFVSLGKAGGYILCATAVDGTTEAVRNVFEFAEDCTLLFQVRNR